MFSIPEQFSAATHFQSNLQSQLNFVNTVAHQAVEGASKAIALTIDTARASVEKSTATARQLLQAKDPQEFFSLASHPGTFDGLVEYGRELAAIAAALQTELVKAAHEQTKDVPGVSLKLAGPAKPVKQIVVTDGEEVVAPKAAKSKAKAAAEVEVVVEEEEVKSPFPTAASVEAEAKPAKAKAKPVH